MNTMNMWSNVQSFWSFPCAEPFYVDLSVGYAWSFTVANTTDDDITSGTLELWGADALPSNWCAPGEFEPMDPVAGCSAIVSGIAEPGPVSVIITPEMPIRARSICKFSAPCPRMFFQLRGLPAGAQAFATVSSLRRTNWDHTGPWGRIPAPMDLGVETMQGRLPPAHQLGLPPGQPQQAPPGQPQPQGRERQPVRTPEPTR